MKVERVDSIQGVLYVMTETHRYASVLPGITRLEPAARPIRHVSADSSFLATGYKIPADAPALEKIMRMLQEADAQP